MTLPPPHRVLDAAIRTDFFLFVMKVYATLHPGEPPLAPTWYLRAMCHFAVTCIDGERQRGVVNVPPRHLKSITFAVALVAWQLGRDPTKKIMVANYSENLSRELAEKCRTIMETDWYKRLFPGTRIDSKRNRALHFHTTRGGSRMAISVEGSITGFGADIIILDDCMKADDVFSQVARDNAKRWFDNTLSTRLNSKKDGVIISIQQRLHEDDLSAYILSKGYDHLCLPAVAITDETIQIGPAQFHHRKIDDLLDPIRENTKVLADLRRSLGPQIYSAQYQQDPTPPEGTLINPKWFRKYLDGITRDGYTKILQSWDTASSCDPKSDWSVCTTWGFEYPYWDLLGVYRRRVDFPQLRRDAKLLYDEWRPNIVLVEDASSGRALVQDLCSEGYTRFRLIKPKGDKYQRVVNITGELEAGDYHLPKEAPWLATLISELKAFPFGTHDDQVDSVTQAINFVRTHWKWAHTEYTESGRPIGPVRANNRAELRKLHCVR